MRREIFGFATLAGEPYSASDISFGYHKDDLARSKELAGLYARLETHKERACDACDEIGVAYRESCIADFIEDFVVGEDDPALCAGSAI